MALLALSVACTAGGTTQITLSFANKRSGSSNDSISFRVVRQGGSGDYIIPGEPSFILFGDQTGTSWSWLDVGTPVETTYTYVLQIKRNSGAGTIYDMNYIAVHYGK